MKRRLLIIAIFLLVGAVVNVAVAWGVIARARWAQMTPSLDQTGHPWPVTVPELWPPADGLITRRSVGLVVRSWHTSERREIRGVTTLRWSKHFVVRIAESGLPFSTLRWQNPPAPESVVGTDVHHHLRFGRHPTPTLTLWTRGIRIPDGVPGFRERYWKVLPVQPIWPGFAVNTLLYATLLWLLIPGPFALRRLLRVRRGLCPECAYPIGESSVCTECGRLLPKRVAT